MAGIKNFQVSRNKATKSVNIFEKGVSRRRDTKSDRLLEGAAVWGSFYRANPQRFVKEYLGIELKLFQQILLYGMMHFNFMTYIAARGKPLPSI